MDLICLELRIELQRRLHRCVSICTGETAGRSSTKNYRTRSTGSNYADAVWGVVRVAGLASRSRRLWNLDEHCNMRISCPCVLAPLRGKSCV